jgi:hypothetical protein
MVLGPVADLHTEFPYSRLDEWQRYVGVPNLRLKVRRRRKPTLSSDDSCDEGLQMGHATLPFCEGAWPGLHVFTAAANSRSFASVESGVPASLRFPLGGHGS